MGLLGRSKATEYQRTCRRCGTVWYVTPADRKLRRPNNMQIAGQRMRSAGKRGQLVGGKKKAMIAEQRIARMEGERDRYDRINRCGECGSTQFIEVAAT